MTYRAYALWSGTYEISIVTRQLTKSKLVFYVVFLMLFLGCSSICELDEPPSTPAIVCVSALML